MTAPGDAAPASPAPASPGSNAQKAPVEASERANDPLERRPSPRRLARLGTILFFDGFRAAPGWMAMVTAMLVLGSVAATCYPLGYKLIADGALGGNESELVEGVAVVAVLLGLAWVLVGIGATEAMALSDRIAVYRTRRMIELISGVPTLEHLERPDYLAQVEQLNSGRRRLASAPRQILSNVSMAARIIVLLILLGSVSPWLLLVPVAAAPPLIADRVAKKITKKSEDDMATDRRLSGMIFDVSSSAWAAGELRSYGLAPRLKSLHASLIGSLDRRAAREARKVLAVQSVGWLLYAAGLMAAIAFVAIRASDSAPQQGAISLGTVLMTVSLIRRSRAQLASTASASAGMVATLATADRLLWLEDHHAAAVAAAGTDQAPGRLRSAITVRDLSFTYPGTERVVLSALNLTFPAGATVAVVGENGSGKTTLVKLLLGMYQPTSGSILIDDVPLTSIAHDSWRERCTAAFQDFARFSLPAVESIGVADLPELSSEPLALAALDRAGAGGLAAQLPDGLATFIGGDYTGGQNLSGGQWQKLALGRAMRTPDPLLVVLDEPTASLDAHAEQALFDRYTSAAAGYAAKSGTVTLLVSHRFATVRMADLIVYLEEGHVIEAGTHDELLARGGRYAELFTLQAEGYR
jgi:ATP-binding cassette, subfamily B, bacterial